MTNITLGRCNEIEPTTEAELDAQIEEWSKEVRHMLWGDD